jgi:murein DD-endopeptidase MepM/ murein hydrolase activator NlpD
LSELNEQIDDINEGVAKKKAEMQALNGKIDLYKDLISEKKAEAASLSDEIALIENRMAKEQLSIDIAREEIKSIELEIDLLDRQIGDNESKATKERKLLGSLARKLYRERAGRSSLEILFSNDSVSSFFDSLHATAKLQSAVNDSLKKVKALRDRLEEDKKSRETKRLDALDRKRQMEVSKLALDDQRSLKQSILIETKSSELQYRYLLADLKQEQSEADSEIMYLEKVLRQKTTLAERLKDDAAATLSWPVVPTRGISAIFHDPDYPFRYIFEHPGIDVRVSQGTPIRAAASGVVARAKDAGMGYNYVMLIHSNDLATVYGHLSKISAKEDTFVERGEIIGYSGGMPGTPGAGRLTTGPHLHFETRLDGIPVNPTRYLVAF